MKTQLKRNTPGSRLSPFPVASVRSATVPNQYVDPERLHEALQTLTATRTALLAACDQADLASSRAGTPLRTHNVRSQIELLTNEVRIVESRIAQAAAGELAQRHGVAAGVGRALSSRRPNEIDREFDPIDRSGRFDPRFRDERDFACGRARGQGFDPEWEFLHRSLRDPRWNKVARGTNQKGPIDPNLLTQFPTKAGSTSPKPAGQSKPSNPMGPPLPVYSVSDALTIVRKLLKDGGWGEDRLTNGELKSLATLFTFLDSTTATAVISALTDAELKLIADDMDSSGIGNYDGLSSTEKEAFIASLAKRLDAKQFERIAVAFDDVAQFAEILADGEFKLQVLETFLDFALARSSVNDVEARALAELICTLGSTRFEHWILGKIGSDPATDSQSETLERFLTKVLKASARDPKFAQGTAGGKFIASSLLEFAEMAQTMIDAGAKLVLFGSLLPVVGTAYGPDKKKLLDQMSALAASSLGSWIDLYPDRRRTLADWLTLVLREQGKEKCLDLFRSLKSLNTPEGSRQRGFFFGTLCIAIQRIERLDQATQDLVFGLLGALTNGFSVPGVEISANLVIELIKSELIMVDLKKTPFEAVVYEQILRLLNQNKEINDEFTRGYQNATIGLQSLR
jgi:hypothetical protein